MMAFCGLVMGIAYLMWRIVSKSREEKDKINRQEMNSIVDKWNTYAALHQEKKR